MNNNTAVVCTIAAVLAVIVGGVLLVDLIWKESTGQDAMVNQTIINNSNHPIRVNVSVDGHDVAVDTIINPHESRTFSGVVKFNPGEREKLYFFSMDIEEIPSSHSYAPPIGPVLRYIHSGEVQSNSTTHEDHYA